MSRLTARHGIAVCVAIVVVVLVLDVLVWAAVAR